jgi:hypothetical protein
MQTTLQDQTRETLCFRPFSYGFLLAHKCVCTHIYIVSFMARPLLHVVMRKKRAAMIIAHSMG